MKTQRIIPKRNKRKQPTSAEIRRINFFLLKKKLPRNVALHLDGIMCSASGEFHLDVFKLEKQIPNYNGDACTYKDKPKYSMSMAIEEEWGKEVCDLIRSLL